MTDSDFRPDRQKTARISGPLQLPPTLAARVRITDVVPFGLATPCWAWLGAHDSRGYGRIRVGGRVDYVRRVVLRCDGAPLGRERQVISLCRWEGCVSPHHHLTGTKEEARAFGKFGHLATTDFAVAHLCLATGEATKGMLVRALRVSGRLLADCLERCSEVTVAGA